jgi:hypothetical protein
MAQTLRWRDILPGIFQGTPWLNGYWGSRWLWTVALMADAAFEGIHLSLRGRWLTSEQRAPDAIDTLGAERSIIRREAVGLSAAETDNAYAARIVNAWDYWQEAGNVKRMQDEIRGLGYTTATIYRPLHRAGEWSRPGPNGALDYWSIFWVHIGPSDPGVSGLLAELGTWDDGSTWDDGTAWEGLRLAKLKDLCRRLKPITWVGEIVIVLVGDVWDDGGTWDDGGVWVDGTAIYTPVP